MKNETISNELREALMKVMRNGNEAKAREFIITHLKEFPQDTQDVIIMAFFEEGLEKQNADDKAIADFRKEGIKTVNALGKIKEELEKHLKLAEIKESL